MEISVPYPTMDWTSDNLKEAWTRFKNHATLMFEGPLSEKTEKVQCAFLLIWLGDKGRDIFSTFTFTKEEKDKIQSYMNKLTKYFNPKKQHCLLKVPFS